MNSMKAAPIVTLPQPIARHAIRDALSRPDPEWHALGRTLQEQLHAGPAVTITLAARDLLDTLSLLLEFSIELQTDELTPATCGFTLDEIQYTLDAHEHFFRIRNAELHDN